MTNIFDHTSNAKTYPLASTILAAAKDGTMGVEEIQQTIAGLTKLLEVKASQDNAKKQRIAKMNATSIDPKFQPIVKRADGELRRLGFEGGINAFAAENGSMTKLDEAMTAANMDTEKRVALKTNLHVLGLVD